MMIRMLSFAIILILSTAGLILLHNTLEVFLLETATQFQNLVRCSDTQMAQSCWKKFGEEILSLAKPGFSELAYQIAEVCLQQAESQHLHDLQFLLNVQKCFHLADLIDRRSACPSCPLEMSRKPFFETWLMLTQTLVLIYLVLSVSDRTFLGIWEAMTVGWEFFKNLLLNFLNTLRSNLKLLFSKYYWCQSSTNEEELLSSVFREATSSERPLGAKWPLGAKTTTGSVLSEILVRQGRVPDNFKHTDEKNFTENRTKRRRKLPYQSACEVSDYESHNACGQDSDDYTDTTADEIAGRSKTFCPTSLKIINFEKQISTIIPIQREKFGNQVTISRGSRIVSKEIMFGPHEITTTDDIRVLNFPKTTNSTNGKELNDENNFSILDVKPSFDISTESGRDKMKAFVKAKMGCKRSQASSKNESESYRSLTRVDDKNLKMRRVFVTNKGWIWLSNLESNGVQFLSGREKGSASSRHDRPG